MPKGKATDKSQLPQGWPQQIEYLRQPVHSPRLSTKQQEFLKTPTTSPQTTNPSFNQTINLPYQVNPKIEIRQITNPAHPAYTQNGLFAVSDLAPDSFIIPYFGLVHNNDDCQDQLASRSSDYDLSLDRDAGLSIDAAGMGNEGRAINDYRGVSFDREGQNPDYEKMGPNAEFHDIWMTRSGKGERGVGVFVLSAGATQLKKGKVSRNAARRRRGISAGEEILVSYGKGFWAARIKDVGLADEL